MAVNMFRAVSLCFMFAVAQAQDEIFTLACIKMSATMGGGLCDAMLGCVACSSMQGFCAMGGGTANNDFCAPGVTSGFCNQSKAMLLSKNPICSNYADCVKGEYMVNIDLTVGCCADYKTVLGQMCTGIKDLDATVIF